jgi:ligand-binding SRPBCC domain-containing protein
MRTYSLETEQRLNRPRAEVFDFFSNPRNLETITPPWLRFEIHTPGEITMRPGARIDYVIRLHGIPVKWQTEISVWEPPSRFVDEQIKGPYRVWVHEHLFEEDGAGTRVRDRVRYAVPGGWLVRAVFVRRDLRKIFDYRKQTLASVFE